MPDVLAVDRLRQGGADVVRQLAQIEVAELEMGRPSRVKLRVWAQRLTARSMGLDQGRRDALDLRIVAALQPVGDQERRREDVAGDRG